MANNDTQENGKNQEMMLKWKWTRQLLSKNWRFWSIHLFRTTRKLCRNNLLMEKIVGKEIRCCYQGNLEEMVIEQSLRVGHFLNFWENKAIRDVIDTGVFT